MSSKKLYYTVKHGHCLLMGYYDFDQFNQSWASNYKKPPKKGHPLTEFPKNGIEKDLKNVGDIFKSFNFTLHDNGQKQLNYNEKETNDLLDICECTISMQNSKLENFYCLLIIL